MKPGRGPSQTRWRRAAAARRYAAALLCGAVAAPWAAAAGWPADLPADGLADAAVGQAARWQLTLRSDRHSDALALTTLGSDQPWRGLAPRPGRNLAYVDDELRLSRQQAGWVWSLLARSQATLVASDQALALAAQVAQGQRPATDAAWLADVRLRGFAGAGLALGRSQALAPGWVWQAEAQLLALGRWRERRIQGPVQYSAASGSYSFQLQSDELDNRLDYPFRQGFAARGAGLLLAGGLAWQGPSAWAEIGLRDGGWLRWRGVPQQQATLDTATQAVDGDGFLIYQPLIVGRNRQAATQRWLPWRGRLAGGLLLGDGQSQGQGQGQRLGLQLDTLPGYGVLPALLWQRPAASPGALALGAEWRLHERRLTLSAAWRGLSLRAGADRLGSGAHSREFSLAWRSGF